MTGDERDPSEEQTPHRERRDHGLRGRVIPLWFGLWERTRKRKRRRTEGKLSGREDHADSP